jgi:zinc protease
MIMKLNRSIKPSPSADISFKMYPLENFSLDNAIEIYFIKKDELPIIRMSVIINAGSRLDKIGGKGTANLLAMCIDEGAGKYNALELSDQFDLLGTQLSIYCNSDHLLITLQVLKENFDESLRLLNLIMNEPQFKVENFEREKRKILTRLRQLSDDPDYLANTSFESLLLGKENPYSFPSLGIEKDIDNITNEQIKSFYSQIISPNNSFIVVVGDISTNDLKSKLNGAFSNWDRGKSDLQFVIKKNNDKKSVYIVDKKDSVQTEIRIGHHTNGRNSPDYFNKHILNTILGGQFTSRINLNLREKHGYTYGAGSIFNYYKDSAYFEVSTSVGINNTVNSMQEILNELDNIRQGVTEKELNFAKSSITRKFPLNFETHRQIASNVIGKIIYNLPEDYFETYINKINLVTINDVNKAATENIFPDLATIVLVGDKDKISDQLKTDRFGEVQIIE